MINLNNSELYTIGGKQYTERDINQRCAEIEEIDVAESVMQLGSRYIPTGRGLVDENFILYDPCNNLSDTDAIIDKCLDELLSISVQSLSPNTLTKWGCIIEKHNCTKLVAACICYIEINS